MSLGLKNIVFCGVGCVLGVGIIAGNYFGIKIDENGVTGLITRLPGVRCPNSEFVTVWAAHGLPKIIWG